VAAATAAADASGAGTSLLHLIDGLSPFAVGLVALPALNVMKDLKREGVPGGECVNGFGGADTGDLGAATALSDSAGRLVDTCEAGNFRRLSQTVQLVAETGHRKLHSGQCQRSGAMERL